MESKAKQTKTNMATNVDQSPMATNIFFTKYLQSLTQTPHRLRKRMLVTWTPDQELNRVRLRSGADMKRKLMWYDLVALGVGGMLGVGVFVTTGPVALQISGPSVFISYIIAGISALLSSLCYTEFSVQIPVAGGAFSYLRVTFGMQRKNILYILFFNSKISVLGVLMEFETIILQESLWGILLGLTY